MNPGPRSKLFRPRTPAQLDACRKLVWQELRQPWGQPPDTVDAAEERGTDHLAARLEDGRIIAYGRLLQIGPGLGQIRSMVVAPGFRGHGLGRTILQNLESLARGRGIGEIRIHARESAFSFYAGQDYIGGASGTLLFGEIPHRWLHKFQDCHVFRAYGLQCQPANRDDGAEVADLVFEVLAAYGMQPETDGIDRDLLDLESFYREGFFDLLRDDQGRLQGTVAVLRLSAGRGELRRMYLRPEVRGKGLGRACLGHALAWSRETGVHTLELETATRLHEARALYQWAGFEAMPAGHCEARRCDLRLQLHLTPRATPVHD